MGKVWLYKTKDIYKFVEEDSPMYKFLIKSGWTKSRLEAPKTLEEFEKIKRSKKKKRGKK